jgi:hypothetical protein
MGEAEGVAHGQDPITDLKLVGVAQAQEREIVLLDLDHRQVAGRIGTDDFGRVLAAVLQLDPHRVRLGDHMVVGQDVSVRRDDEPRTLPDLMPFPGKLGLRMVLLRDLAEETAEEIVVEGVVKGGKELDRPLTGDLLFHLDEDHGGRDLLGHAAEGFAGLAQVLQSLILSRGR